MDILISYADYLINNPFPWQRYRRNDCTPIGTVVKFNGKSKLQGDFFFTYEILEEMLDTVFID